MAGWWAPARRTSAGLPPEHHDPPVERGRARAHPRVARPGARVLLRVDGLRPEELEGPVDLTIYGPGDGRAAPASRRATPDPEYHEVLVEATLDVGGRGPRGGRARFVLRTDKGDRPGQYIAVFRRTDVSSRPVAACRFQLRR